MRRLLVQRAALQSPCSMNEFPFNEQLLYSVASRIRKSLIYSMIVIGRDSGVRSDCRTILLLYISITKTGTGNLCGMTFLWYNSLSLTTTWEAWVLSERTYLSSNSNSHTGLHLVGVD